MKRTLSAVIAMLMLLSAVACGSEKQGGTDAQNTGDTSSDESKETTPFEISDDLPDTDLNGYNFRILGFGDNRFAAVYVEEQTGSLVNDAVYKKIRKVKDRFNCEITLAEGSTTGTTDTTTERDTIQKAILSNEDSFDIATAHDITMANMTLENYFINLYDVPHLNFDKPWWPKYTVESLTFDDQMYMFSNSLSYNNLGDTRVMYFNKKLLEENNIDAPYQLVYDNEWTLDKLNSITATGYKDLNGNTEIDLEDQFGIVNAPYYYCFLEPFHLEPYQKNGDTLTYSFDLAKYQTVVEKFYSLLIGDGGFIAKDGTESNKIFSDGHAMFIYQSLNTAVKDFSLTDVSYGILPMPKLEKNNEPYFSGCTDRPCVVPITASEHLDATGLIIEALSAEGYKQVYPAYFEQALKARYADQNDDAKMLDIITENVILSFTYMYGNFKSPYNIMLETLFKKGKETKDVASYAASIEAAQQKRCADITEKYHAMKEG